MNVSKELLSEVLGYAVSSIYIAPNGNFIEAQSKYRDERINIHELQHSCKEWAYRQIIGKTGTYFNGCGRSQQHQMYNINIITSKYDKDLYMCTIDNGKDLNCNLEFYGLTGRDNHPKTCFNVKANKVRELRWYADTEPEAVFAAAQWILDNKDKQ